MIEFSTETLTHLNCSKCAGWWSWSGELENKSAMYCPHCGERHDEFRPKPVILEKPAAEGAESGKYTHPLEHIAKQFMQDKRRAIDVWDLAAALGRPNLEMETKGYDVVAADILEVMFHSGRATRTGNGNPKRPEQANFFYSLID